ncbi:MAG: MGMT family protein [bacterium]|nr:MGMT family protein [bacterium]
MGDKFKSRTFWREKLEKELPSHGKLVDIPPKMQKRFGIGKMLIPKPLDVDALIRKIPEGKLVTVEQIRERLAKDYHADTTCPLTTGIFIRIAAETSEEDLINGEKKITPYWRVIKRDGSLNEKLPGGIEAQATRLRREGHLIEPGRGKKPPKVRDFEKYLQKL